MTRFNAFLLFAAVFMHTPAAAGEFVFTLRGFLRGEYIKDWRMPDDPLAIRAVLLVGKSVKDCVPEDVYRCSHPAMQR